MCIRDRIATLNTVVIRTLSYVPLLLWIVYVEQMGWGISRWLGISGWTEFLVTIIILDLFDYFWHLANHRITFLWRFHKAHHSDNDMDIFTALRFHPGELLISSLVKASWVVIWGPSAIAWFLFEALVSLSAQFHHSNIQLPDHVDKRLSSFLVTPKLSQSSLAMLYGGSMRTRSTDLSSIFCNSVRQSPFLKSLLSKLRC